MSDRQNTRALYAPGQDHGGAPAAGRGVLCQLHPRDMPQYPSLGPEAGAEVQRP